MPKLNAPLYSLNGGEVSDEALARLDLERLQFAGSLYSNVLPRVVGSMTLRPGLEHVAAIADPNVELMEFNYSLGEKYLPVFSNNELRILRGNSFISRDAVATSLVGGDFSAFTGWFDTSTGSATATVAGGNLVLSGAAFRRAEAAQAINVAVADQATEHGLRISVERGPVSVGIGSVYGLDDILSATTLDDGDHSLTFTPNGAQVVLRIWSDVDRQTLVSSCEIEGAGEVILATPYRTEDLPLLRYRQSIDTVFIASRVYQQRELIRTSESGWSLQRYKVDDGPFEVYTGDITMTPSAFSGVGILAASFPYFEDAMIGRLFRLTQAGQTTTDSFDGAAQGGSEVRISGVGAARTFNYSVSGAFTGTWSLQIADDDGSGNPGAWTTVAQSSVPFAAAHTDPDNNVIKFARFLSSGASFAGSMICTISYVGGSQDGICRVTGIQSPTIASMEVLERFFSLSATSDWDFSTWSDFDGWPGTVSKFSGRLFWETLETAYGSVSDDFKGYSDKVEGDSAPIIRSLNAEGNSGGRWMLDLQRLIVGTDTSEVSVRSSAFDEPLTAANWFPLDASTQGSHDVRALKSDKDGIYVAADGVSLHRLAIDATQQDYYSTDLTELHQEIFGGSKVKALAIQRKPDTVVWVVLEDGSCRALTYEPQENVIAWSRIATDGLFKSVAVLKGGGQDDVYFSVQRGSVSAIEKMAQIRDCRSISNPRLGDAHTVFTGAPQTTFSVPHLDGKDVTVWADGVAINDQRNLYTVTGGVVTIPSASDVVIGLPYSADYVSTKLAYGAGLGTAMFQPKRISSLGLYFIDTILDGVFVGRDADNLFQFTVNKNDAPITPGDFQDEFDQQLNAFSGDWDTDSRVHMRLESPYPATVAAMAIQVKTNDIG